MDLRIVTASESGLVDQVIRLGDRNSAQLGHFPEQAYRREAAKGRIVAAVAASNTVVGYVLFRTTRDRAVVQHLCVDMPARGRGVARRLMDEVKRRTRHLPAVVCHCAREFSAIEVWKKLGFVPLDEKKGRGRTQRPLIRLVYDHGHEHLFSAKVEQLASSTVVAAMDVNVCIDLQDDREDDPEIDALRSDWLLEEVSLWVTDEAMAEVERQDDTAERRRRMTFLRGQNALRRDHRGEDAAYARLKELVGHDRRPQDRSDLLQLAQAIAGGADVFLSRDERLLRHAGVIEEHFDLAVMRPADLVVRLDEVVRADDYAPERLHGSAIEGRLVRQADLAGLLSVFLNHGRGESMSRLSDLLREHVAAPKRSIAFVVGDEPSTYRALMLITQEQTGCLRVSGLRVVKDRLAETLTRHLLAMAMSHGQAQGCNAVSVDEPYPIHGLEPALRTMGFVPSGEKWMKLCITGLTSRTEAATIARELAASQTELRAGGMLVSEICDSTDRETASDAVVERLIWPGRLRSSPLRTFVVPIRPRFARNLFDRKLAEESVFGGDPSLVLNCENVYYRSSHIEIVTAPSRILWYVTADQGEAVRQLRAMSSVLETEVGTAKDLFRKYRRLGVYEWGDVRNLAGGDPAGEIMAIRFGPTECFPRPLAGAMLKSMIQKWRGTAKPPPLTMPVEIPPACFESLHELAYDS